MIVFDLDGTLALDTHRSHHLKKEPKDWDTYFSLCEEDEVNLYLRELLAMLYSSRVRIAIWSGRSATVRPQTERWLMRNGIWSYIWDFRMRKADDRTQDDVLKERWLHEWDKTNPSDPVTIAFEDRARAVEMWRRNGVVCCQVAPGDF